MIGERFGPWAIEKPLGQGGMGNVYLAKDGEGRPAAVKVLHAALAQQQGFQERFNREIAALRELRHENIVQFFDSGVHRHQPYYAMEFVDGPSVAEALEERGALPWEEVVKIAIQVCKALQAAHQQEMIHRDLKPSNLLLTRDGVVKLADFGVAKLFAAGPMTLEETIVGTPDYLAPEQATGRPVTKRSDLYALGVVLYQLLTGRLPFLAETAAEMVHLHKFGTFDPPSKYAKELPHELDELIAALLAKEPEKRPGSAAIVADMLGRLQRKMARKREHTVDVSRGGATKVIGGQADEQNQAKRNRGLAFPERPPAESVPWGRIAVLSLLLAGLAAVVAWGLQPPSPEKLLAQAAAAIDAGDWSGAETALDRLKAKHPEHPYADRVAEQTSRIQAGRQAAKARREAGAFLVSAPSCEAERLYRRGVVEFLGGKTAEAKLTWSRLAAAYAGIASQESWVKLAQAALAETEKPSTKLGAAAEALKKCETEKPDEAQLRLASLLQLYRGEAGSPEGDALLSEIEARLTKLRSMPPR